MFILKSDDGAVDVIGLIFFTVRSLSVVSLQMTSSFSFSFFVTEALLGDSSTTLFIHGQSCSQC